MLSCSKHKKKLCNFALWPFLKFCNKNSQNLDIAEDVDNTIVYKFQAKIINNGDKVKIKLENDIGPIKVDPYCCKIEAMVRNPTQLKTVGHIPGKS